MNPGEGFTSATFSPASQATATIEDGDEVVLATYTAPSVFDEYVFLTDELGNILTDNGALIYVDILEGDASTTVTAGGGFGSGTFTPGNMV